MKCRKLRMMISREIDGEIGGAERDEIARHLAACRECRTFSEISRSAMSVHRSIPEVSPPPRLVASILAEAAETRGSAGIPGWLRVAVPVAAAAVFALGFWVGTLMHQQYGDAGVANVASTTAGAEVPELDYLDAYPPGSFGSVLAASYEGGGNETGRP